MSDAYRVELRTVDGGPTALGSAGSLTVVVDRPVPVGGRGLGFSGGQLFYLAVAACVSNDLYREAATRGITIERVAVEVDGDFPQRGSASTPIRCDVDIAGTASAEELAELLAEVDRIAEIPNSFRGVTELTIRARTLTTTPRRTT